MLNEIFSRFNIKGDICEYGNGHINDTYLVQIAPRYILQRINAKIFVPEEVMANIEKVTAHLGKKIAAAGGDPLRETLTVIPTVDGKSFYKADEQNYYRMYKFVEDSVSYDIAERPALLKSAGAAFGRFQRMLDDFPADALHETIVNFHHTPTRVDQLTAAIGKNAAGRKQEVEKEISFALAYAKKYASLITDALESGEVPLRVTHNDTKLNNVLFDKDTEEGLCVIDLDTVMPGSLLYDFGDALRFGASSAAEDEKDLSKVWFDLEKFEAFASGFVPALADCLTEKEIALLPVSALIMTYECGIRFLADYLNGDTYFKIHYADQNLVRAKNQFKLVYDIESKLEQMADIVKKYVCA